MDHNFRDTVAAAGLEDVTPHTLKHTAVTWLLQRGVPIWEVAGYVGTSPQTIARVYGHHHVDHLSAALAAFDRPGGASRIAEQNRQRFANDDSEPKANKGARNGTKRPKKQRSGA
jgi:Phage integrase family